MIRRRLIFYGRVQGVGFRYHAVRKALQLGLTGWVRNLPDETVEMEAQGSPEQIEALIRHMDGQKWIYIEKIDRWELPLQQERDFRELW